MAPASQKEHLNSRALGELKKDDLIRSYVDNQTRFLKTYAVEGRAFLSSWERSGSEKEKEKGAPVVDAQRNSAFETPVLKPRTLEAPAIRPAKRVEPPVENADSRRQLSPVNASVKRPKVSSPVQRSTKCSRTDKENKKSDSAKPQLSKSKARAEVVDESSGDEHKQRLAERRERKRSRRAVTKPNEDPPSERSDEEETVQPKKKRAKKASKKELSRVPAGLALMHGFSSTNVGKNRLTMQPSTGIGVFNRGKSSGNLDVASKQSKRTVSATKVFCESQFLLKAKDKDKAKRPPPRIVSPSPSVQTKTKEKKRSGLCKYRESASHDKTKRNRKSNETLSPTLTRVSSSQLSEKPVPIAESVTWDIEDDAHSLPSGSGVSVTGKQRKSDEPGVRSNSRRNVSKDNAIKEQSAPPSDGPSVVLLRSASAEPVATSRLEDAEKRSSSLHPSDSASQIFRHRGVQDLLPALSKYFAKPTSDPDNSGKTAAASPSIVELPGLGDCAPHRPDSVGAHQDRSRAEEVERLPEPASNIITVSTVSAPVISRRHLSPVDSLEQALGAFQETDPSLSFGIRNRSTFSKTEIPLGGRGATSYVYLSQDSVLSAQEDGPQASYGLGAGEGLPGDYAEDQGYLLAQSILSYSAGDYELEDEALIMDYSDGDIREASAQDLGYSSLGTPLEHHLAGQFSSGHLYTGNIVEDVAEDYAGCPGDDIWDLTGNLYGEHPRMRLAEEHFGFTEDGTPLHVDAPNAASDCDTEYNFALAPADIGVSEVSTIPSAGPHEERRCWMTNGQVLLASQGGHRRRSPPIALETIHGVEQDVARNLRDHWRPHRL
ncbi:hypothetical protein DENSPDRAFT_830944 [Dentipellis sp. KUC8613]|nr:hypothetical protein DENSPDRAFT_830944 [Dentipellis sp. KUC8613]